MPKKKEPNWKEKIVREIQIQGAIGRPTCRENTKPEKAAEMVSDLMNGMGSKAWMDKWRLGGVDYTNFRNKYMPLLAERKEWLARNNVKVAQMAQELQLQKMEMLAEDPEELRKVNVRDLAMTANLAVQGFVQMTDGNRVVVEHQKGVTLEDAAAMVAAAKERARAKIMGQAVDVVVEEANNEQKQSS